MPAAGLKQMRLKWLCIYGTVGQCGFQKVKHIFIHSEKSNKAHWMFLSIADT